MEIGVWLLLRMLRKTHLRFQALKMLFGIVLCLFNRWRAANNYADSDQNECYSSGDGRKS